jgi:hypothetical protein
MSRETMTTPKGETLTILTGKEADDAVLESAKECAKNGGVVATEVVVRSQNDR